MNNYLIKNSIYNIVISQNMTYEQIFAQTSPYHTTVYIGNLPHGITRK